MATDELTVCNRQELTEPLERVVAQLAAARHDARMADAKLASMCLTRQAQVLLKT